jgi:hypothetical protein
MEEQMEDKEQTDLSDGFGEDPQIFSNHIRSVADDIILEAILTVKENEMKEAIKKLKDKIAWRKTQKDYPTLSGDSNDMADRKDLIILEVFAE